jgi:hypothetical protein
LRIYAILTWRGYFMVNSIVGTSSLLRGVKFDIQRPSLAGIRNYFSGLTIRAPQARPFQSTTSTITAKAAINFSQIVEGFTKTLKQAGQISFHRVGELTEAVKQVSAKAQTSAKFAQMKGRVEEVLTKVADPFASLESHLSAMLRTPSPAVKLLTFNPDSWLSKTMMPFYKPTLRQGLTLA